MENPQSYVSQLPYNSTEKKKSIPQRKTHVRHNLFNRCIPPILVMGLEGKGVGGGEEELMAD